MLRWILWREAKLVSLSLFPYRMKLCLNEDFAMLPHQPATIDASAMLVDMVSDVLEAKSLPSSRNRLARHDDLPLGSFNSRFDEPDR
jgi:hypothetical protein